MLDVYKSSLDTGLSDNSAPWNTTGVIKSGLPIFL
jgi:hypothetical protein